MAKMAIAEMLDVSLNYIKNNTTKMVACSSQPTVFSDANTTLKLAEVSLSASDFSISNGLSSGRRITVSSKTNVPVVTTGVANHVALLDANNNKVLYVTTAPVQNLIVGGTVTFSSWDIEISNPV